MKTSTIVGILVVLFVILGGWYVSGLPPMDKLQFGQAPIPEGVVCTADAMQCPDGSYVGRTGPTCEFVCPASTGASASVQTSVQASTSWQGGGAQDDPGLGDMSVPQ